MNKKQFEEQIERLRENYGEKAMPNQRAALLWREYGHANLEDFRCAIDAIILSCRFAPMLEEFRLNFTGKTKGRRETRIDFILKSNDCTACDNTGSIAVNNRTKRCFCRLGDPGLCLPAHIDRIDLSTYTAPKKAKGNMLDEIKKLVDNFNVRKI